MYKKPPRTRRGTKKQTDEEEADSQEEEDEQTENQQKDCEQEDNQQKEKKQKESQLNSTQQTTAQQTRRKQALSQQSDNKEICVNIEKSDAIRIRECQLYRHLIKNSLFCLLEICIRLSCEFLKKADESGHYFAEAFYNCCSFCVQICQLVPYCCFCCYVKYLGCAICRPCHIFYIIQGILLFIMLVTFIYFIISLTVMEKLMKGFGYTKVGRQYHAELYKYTNTLYKHGMLAQTTPFIPDLTDMSFDTWELPSEIPTPGTTYTWETIYATSLKFPTINTETLAMPTATTFVQHDTEHEETTVEVIIENAPLEGQGHLIDIPVAETAVYDNFPTTTKTIQTEATESDTLDSVDTVDRNKNILAGLRNVDLGYILESSQTSDAEETTVQLTPSSVNIYTTNAKYVTNTQMGENKNLLDRLKDIIVKKMGQPTETLNFYSFTGSRKMDSNFLFDNTNAITLKIPKRTQTFFEPGPGKRLMVEKMRPLGGPLNPVVNQHTYIPVLETTAKPLPKPAAMMDFFY